MRLNHVHCKIYSTFLELPEGELVNKNHPSFKKKKKPSSLRLNASSLSSLCSKKREVGVRVGGCEELVGGKRGEGGGSMSV